MEPEGFSCRWPDVLQCAYLFFNSLAKHGVHSLIDSLVKIVSVAHEKDAHRLLIPSLSREVARRNPKVFGTGYLGFARNHGSCGRYLDGADDAAGVFQIRARRKLRVQFIETLA